MAVKTYFFTVTFVICSVAAYKVSEHASYKYYPRSSWKAAEATDHRPLKTPVSYVVIHHTYIPGACHDYTECSAAMRGMQKYHMGLGWGDIGYNFCIGNDGAVYEGRGWETVGIHAGRANNYSIGICLIGDWREELPPPISLEATKDLIAEGISIEVISPEYKLIGHSQAMPTECPGRTLLEYISTWDHYTPGQITFE